MRRANPVQHSNERHTIFVTQSLQRFLVRSVGHDVELCEQRKAFVGDPAQMLSSVLRTTLTANEFLGFEPIEQPRDAWRLFDHPLGDLERRQPLVARAAQDAEDVELLKRDPVRLDEGGGLPANEVGRPHQAQSRLVRRRSERPALLQLALQGG